jgi:hypothetical protein
MQVLWMLMITLALALSGVLGLGGSGTRCREDQAPLIPRPSHHPHCTVRLAVDATRSRSLACYTTHMPTIFCIVAR